MEDLKSADTIVEQPSRGSRGEVGTASPSQVVKKLWKAHQGKKMSLKRFARDLISGKNEEHKKASQDWFECKAGALNAEPSEGTIIRRRGTSAASKARKSKNK